MSFRTIEEGIAAIQEMGIVTHSPGAAVLQVKYEEPYASWGADDYRNAMMKILGEDNLQEQEFEYKTLHDLKFTFQYFIQHAVRNQFLVEDDNPEETGNYVASLFGEYLAAYHDAQDFQKKHSTSLSLEPDYGVSAKGGKAATNRRAGSKADKAYAIYCEHVNDTQAKKVITELFQRQLDMSKGGSTTYFYNCKKRYNQENA